MDATKKSIWTLGAPKESAPLYLSDAEKARWARIRGARMLYRGEHKAFFLDERRTAFDFPEVRVQGERIRLYCVANMLRMISLKIADLLLGERPAIRVDDPAQQDQLDELAKRSNLHQVFYTAAKESSWAAECFVQAVRYNGQVYVQNLAPDELYPVGEIQPDGQHQAYRRYATAQVGRETLLLVTEYSAGAITRWCFELKDDGTRVPTDIGRWPVAGLANAEATGLDRNVVCWMAGEEEEGVAVSDYETLIEAQDRLNSKVTQIARVLAKHSDPKLAMPETASDAQGNVRASADLFFFRSKEEIPQYIVWNAELQSALADRDFALSDLCVQSEISQVLLGLPGAQVPDTARGLRLRCTSALSKAQRRAARLIPFMERAIETARAMEAQGKLTQAALLPVGIEMRDGLPTDEIDQANALATLRAGGLLSRVRGVNLLVPDPDAAAKEVAELEEEDDGKMPSVLIGEPGETNSATDQTQMNTDNAHGSAEDEDVTR